MDINQIMTSLEAKHPGESEYLQAVKEVLLSIEDIYNQHPEFEKASLIERLVEPGRINDSISVSAQCGKNRAGVYIRSTR